MATTARHRVNAGMLAFGLDWQPMLANDEFDPALEARMIALEKKFRECVIHQRKRTLVGYFPPTELSARGAVYSAAVIAALGSKGPTVYIAALPDGRYWLCHVQADQLLSTTRPSGAGQADVATLLDVLVSAQSVAQQLNTLLTGLRTRGDRALTVVTVGEVAIDSVDVRNVSPISFEQFYAGAGKPEAARIKPVFPSPYRYLPHVAAITLVIGGALGWREYEIRQALAAEAAEKSIPAEVSRLRDQRITDAVAETLRVDSATVSPGQLAHWCSAFVGRLGIRYHGWRVTSIVCDGASNRVTAELVADLRAPESPNPSALARAVASDNGSAQFAADLQTASLSYPLPLLPTRVPVQRDDLPPHSSHVHGLGSAVVAARRADKRLNANLSPASPRVILFRDPAQRDPTTRIETEQPVPPERSYVTMTIDVTAPVAPANLPIDIDQPNYRVDRMEIRPAAGATTTHVILTALYQPG